MWKLLAEAGLTLLGYTNEPLAWILFAIAAAVAAWKWSKRRRRDKHRKVNEARGGPATLAQMPGLSDFQRDRAVSMAQNVSWNHGHLELQGILDDLLAGKRLSGPCSICGVHRMKMADGKIHDADKG